MSRRQLFGIRERAFPAEKNSMCKGPQTERLVCSVSGKLTGKWQELRSEE